MRNIFFLLFALTILSASAQEKNIPNEFDFGKTESGLYTNEYFEMEISFDTSWIVQDKQQMNNLIETGSNFATGDDENLKAIVKASQVNSAYLLTVFKYEVGAAVEYNPSILVVAENTKNFPGIKTGSDYLFHAKKLLKQTQMPYYFEKDVVDKTIGNSTFYVLEAKMDYLGQTIIQEYLTTVIKGFSLSLIISYTTESEKAELYEVIEKIKI